MKARRLTDHPIIHPGLSPSIGHNINGPSLIRAPEWIDEPLGRYYLYFADHKGSSIRLAFAEHLEGPWRIHEPGALALEETPFLQHPPPIPAEVDRETLGRARGPGVPSPLADATTPHIASPEAVVVADLRQVRLYFHGLDGFGRQVTRVALSTDGVHFDARPEILAAPYFRTFTHGGFVYGMAMPGIFYRSRDGLTDFERGPTLFAPDMRHAALLVRGDRLLVFWTRVGDAPERILLSQIELSGDWTEWRVAGTDEILRPELPWEGATRPLTPSLRSAALAPMNQLRDPAIYIEEENVYLLYGVAGEAGIAIAELTFP